MSRKYRRRTATQPSRKTIIVVSTAVPCALLGIVLIIAVRTELTANPSRPVSKPRQISLPPRSLDRSLQRAGSAQPKPLHKESQTEISKVAEETTTPFGIISSPPMPLVNQPNPTPEIAEHVPELGPKNRIVPVNPPAIASDARPKSESTLPSRAAVEKAENSLLPLLFAGDYGMSPLEVRTGKWVFKQVWTTSDGKRWQFWVVECSFSVGGGHEITRTYDLATLGDSVTTTMNVSYVGLLKDIADGKVGRTRNGKKKGRR